MSKDQYGYVEHQRLEVEGFQVVDVTATGPRLHDDLVWVVYGGTGGRWLSPEDALNLPKQSPKRRGETLLAVAS